MKILFALILLASPAMANCEPEHRGPFYIRTNKGDKERAAECKQVPQCQQIDTGKMGNCYSPAKIERAYKLLKGKYSRAQLGVPNGWFAFTYLTEDGEQRVSVGCQDKTLSEGRTYWANKPDRREVYAALDYAEAIGRAREWVKVEAKAA